MDELTCKQRLLNTLNGEEVDRVPIFDVLHNKDLIETLSGDKINPENAEDLLCKAAHQSLDLIRHFAIPDLVEPKIFRDENGFVYQYEWWTAHLVERPRFASSREIEYAVRKDIDIIQDCIEKRKICQVARQHVRLFDENFETFEQVKSEFRRLSEKLEGTLMLPPEDVCAVAVATERYDETGWWYLWYDYPETARLYLDALTEYQLAFIDAFADGLLRRVAEDRLGHGVPEFDPVVPAPEDEPQRHAVDQDLETPAALAHLLLRALSLSNVQDDAPQARGLAVPDDQ